MDMSVTDAGAITLPPHAIAGQRAGRLGKRLLLAAAALGIVAAAGTYGYDWWTVGRFQVATDDAYVAANSVLVSPKISGYLAQVLVQDNQKVRAGQVLARIDDRDYRTALAQARAEVAAAQADIDNLQQEIEQQTLTVAQARTLVAADQAATTFSDQQLRRYADLAHTGAGTVQQAQQYQADTQEKQATLAHDQAGIGVALKQTDVLRAQLAKAQATLAQRQAAEHQAELNLSYTTITAPTDGTVGARTLRVGQYVQAGTQLMALVPLAGGLRDGQLQGDAVDRRAAGPGRRRSASTCSPAPSCTAAWTASPRPAARSSRCCRRTTPPATSRKSSSASR